MSKTKERATPAPEVSVTKALARIKTIESRLDQKRENVGAYAARDASRVDPIKEEGGSPAYVGRLLNSIRDLESDLVGVRTAIQKSNFENKLTVCGETKTVQEWLNWRREVLPARKMFLNDILRGVDMDRRHLARRDRPDDLKVHFSEEQMREELAKLVEIEKTLDEELSVYNATVTVRIPE